MRLFRIVVGLVVGAFAFWNNVSRISAHEEEVILVGRSAAGELKVDADFTQPVILPVSIFSGIPGYATGELALHSTILDDPTNDFFQLSTATDFRLILIAKDPGIEVWNGLAYMAIGESYFVGPSPFDTHPIWNIVSGTPGNSYSLTLKLRDLNGVYPDSEPFVLSFSPAWPEFRINIKQVDPQHATLSWPTNAVDWELQASASSAAINWSTVTNAPDIAGTNFSLSISTTNTQQFFRLHLQ
jgi:hypothetical protein